MAYRYAHILIGGFTHRVGYRNGVYKLFDQVYREWAGPRTVVEYFPWYVHPQHIAEVLLDRNEESLRATGKRLKIQLAGFSFGGQTVANVCWALAREWPGIWIDSVSLSDAVARFGRLGWLRAANPFGTIRFPERVRYLTWFRQTHCRWQPRPPFFWPSGHDVTTNRDTNIIGPIEVKGTQHTEMDNAPKWHRSVLNYAEELHRSDPPQPPQVALYDPEGKEAA